MVSVFKTTFILCHGSKSPDLEEIISQVESWARTKVSNIDSREFSNGIVISKGQKSIETIRLETETAKYFGFYIKEDAKTDIWETGLAIKEEDGLHYVSVTLDHAITDGIIQPKLREVRVPSIVKSLMDRFGGISDYPLSSTPTHISATTIEHFLDRLYSPDRKLPFVYLSPTIKRKCIVNPYDVARQVSGIAHTYYTRDIDISTEIKNGLAVNLRCYDGAVRIYWPLTNSNVNTVHPLWTADKVIYNASLQRNLPNTIFMEITKHAVLSQLPFTFKDIQRMKINEDIKKKTEEIKESAKAGDLKSELLQWEKLCSMIQAENDALTVKLAETEQLTASLEQVNSSLESQIESLKFQLNAKSEKTVESNQNKSKGLEEEIKSLKSVKEALLLFEKHHPNEVLWYGSTRKNALNSDYARPSEIYHALSWLSSTYSMSKQGSKVGPLEQSCKLATTMDYNAKQSDATMSQYHDAYHIRWNGKTVTLEEHLKKGNGRKETDTIRIAVFFDDKEKKPVIGYFGLHQKNRYN